MQPVTEMLQKSWPYHCRDEQLPMACILQAANQTHDTSLQRTAGEGHCGRHPGLRHWRNRHPRAAGGHQGAGHARAPVPQRGRAQGQQQRDRPAHGAARSLVGGQDIGTPCCVHLYLSVVVREDGGSKTAQLTAQRGA